jgi:malate dehydrogenase (oxaloacetate-decarboxylating)(NADP+)
VAPAVAKAAMESGVARIKFDIAEYRERLMSKSSNAAYSIMRTIGREARRDPKRIVFPHASNPKLLRAVQQIVDEGIAKPVLVGRRTEIERLCSEMSLDMLQGGPGAAVEVIDPRDADPAKYADKLYAMRQRKGLTAFAAQSLVRKSDYHAAMMVATGDADGMVTGLRLNYPETVRPPLQIFGLSPGAKVAVGMYMMVLQNSVKFFGDTVFNIDPDADTLANITLQMADTVQGFGVVPRIAMISYSNFGTVAHPEVTKIRQALAIVQRARPDLEIDGEMQPEMALDAERRAQYFPFSKLTRNANTLVFSSLAAGNAAYQTLKVLGGASAMGPILLGVARPVAALQNNVTVEEIVNMTAYVVLKAQQQARQQLRA